MASKLPKWAKRNPKDGFIEVKPSVVYPLYLKKLGFEGKTQNELEVARRCFTTDLKEIEGAGLAIRILRDEKYKRSNFPVGDDPSINPNAFRGHYNRIRNG